MTYPLIRLFRYAHGYKGQYIRASIYSILNKIFDIAPEVLIGVAVDSVVKQDKSWLASMGAGDIRQQLVVLGVLTFLIWSFESLFEYLLSVNWRNLAQTVQHHLRLDTYNHVQHLDMAYFEDKSSGNLLSILNDDINQLERF
jgi:ATP-binding cassette subfamily B protein